MNQESLAEKGYVYWGMGLVYDTGLRVVIPLFQGNYIKLHMLRVRTNKSMDHGHIPPICIFGRHPIAKLSVHKSYCCADCISISMDAI